MHRRLVLSLIGLSPLALVATKVQESKSLMDILIRRWMKSKEYTLAVFEAMPADTIEFAPSAEQLSFVQHFMHLSLINNFYIGILMDQKTYKDFDALIKAEFLLKRPDPINLFQPDQLQKRDANSNKVMVSEYISDSFDYVISSLEKLNDSILSAGIQKEKPEFLSGHSNLDLILRGESHTAHHRAQAVAYLRMMGIRPPTYTPYNKL